MRLFDSEIDFPFYNGIPQLSKLDWIIFAVGPILTCLAIFGVIYYIPGMEYLFTDLLSPIMFCLIMLIPVAYVCHGKLSIFFRLPKLGDLKIIVICLILNMAYTLAVGYLLMKFGFAPQANSAVIATNNVGIENLLLAIQLIGEELFKVSVLILALSLIYHFIEDRKVSVIIATVVTMIIFGLIHVGSYDGNLVQCLLLIGLGSIFHLYPYLKTKNVTNSYILHLLIDILPVFLGLLL